MEKRICIVGSGIGGLLSGAILAKHGLKVTVLEARVNIGGYTSSWKRGDYTFESSMHELNGFYPDDKKLRTFRYLGLFDRLKFLKIPSPYTSVFKDYEFRVPHDSEEFRKKLIKEFPDEIKGINYYFDKLEILSKQACEFSQNLYWLPAMKMVPLTSRELMLNMAKTVYTFVWKKVKNPKLRTILAQLHMYYADTIDKLNILYYAAPTFSYYNEAYYISGSSGRLSDALADIIRENGGEVLTRKKVDKITFTGRKATGLIVNGTEKYETDMVLCNAPVNSVFKNMIDKKDIGGFIRHRAIGLKPSMSIFALYIGINCKAEELGIDEYCYVFNAKDDLKDSAFSRKKTTHEERPFFMVSYILDDSLAPPDKTVVSICMPDDIKFWEKYDGNKEEYKAEKKRVADILLDRVEKRFPGFKSKIEIMEIGTPITMKRFSGNPYGSVYGAAQTFTQTNPFRFPNEIKNRNLYFSGAWVTPGGGVSGVMIAAMRTAGLVLKNLGIKNELDSHIEPKSVRGNNI